jgi:hypothetical protein
LPLYPLDLVRYRGKGGERPHDEYLKVRADSIERDQGIVDIP